MPQLKTAISRIGSINSKCIRGRNTGRHIEVGCVKLQRHTSFVAGYVSSGELATLYAALDERDQAFALLERAYAKHDPQLRFLNADPAFDLLRDDPRFQDLLRRVGLK